MIGNSHYFYEIGGHMNFNEYQMLAKRTEKVMDYKERLSHGVIGASAELGELADIIKKHVFHNKPLDWQDVEEEVGDILWYLAILANTLGFKLENSAINNIQKLKIRYPEKYSDNEALNRKDKMLTTGENLLINDGVARLEMIERK